jgi:hypothetical protein
VHFSKSDFSLLLWQTRIIAPEKRERKKSHDLKCPTTIFTLVCKKSKIGEVLFIGAVYTLC